MTDTKNAILGREVHEQIDMRQKVNSLIAVLGYDIDTFTRHLRDAPDGLLDALEARLATEDDDEDSRTKMLSRGGIKMIHEERLARLRAEVERWRHHAETLLYVSCFGRCTEDRPCSVCNAKADIRADLRRADSQKEPHAK
jgi:hypothetical protein